ncbi:MFS transporter [Pueribacillus theae]|uniref:Putative proline/betaine transporter n=1 Tax=Pueribacillus theae TaxID=2171751 RepID=A0A2U1JLN0_9BACI|nr:MFS transporter [Pueribacillus theae]PWA06060.1 MFS transporter [Pueribacillus theae]
MEKNFKRTIMASLIGSVLEWYDYNLYGLMSALVFNKLFFSDIEGSVGVLLSLATFGIGFLVRPIGGIIFGSLGDRLGRSKVLIITILLMGTASTLIGLVPTYNTIGYWAPLILVFLRILQGLGAGSEYAGAVIAIAENAPIKRRGFYASLPYVGVSIGILLSSGIFGLMKMLPQSDFMAWGWRVPFVISIILVIVGLVLRAKLQDSPVFEKAKQQQKRVKHPTITAIRTAPKGIILAWMTSTAENSVGYFFQTFLVAYVVSNLHMSESLTLLSLTALGFVNIFSIPLMGLLSDKVGRRPVIMGGGIASALFAFPLFWLLDTKSPILIVLSIVVGSCIFKGAITAAQAAWFTELYSTEIRYTAFAVGREFPTIIGGLTPTIASGVLILSNGHTWVISLLIVIFSILPFIAALIGPENSHLSLNEINNNQQKNQKNGSILKASN